MWTDADLLAMTERLEKLLGSNTSTPEPQDKEMEVDANEAIDGQPSPQANDIQLPLGWTLIKDTQWKAAPIGVFV